jgi:S1-C subfamily serine protease
MRPRRALPVICGLLVVLSCRAQTPAGQASLQFQNAREVTVSVLAGPHGERNLGSAVWIGDSGYLATCEHVIHDIHDRLLIGIVYDPFVGSGNTKLVIGAARRAIEVTVAASDESMDIAILKAPWAPSDIHMRPLVSGATSETPQAPVVVRGAKFSVGYPKLGDELLLAGYPLQGNDFIIGTGKATGLGFPTGTASRAGLRIMVSLPANPGNSGGPVFNQSGEVVGLLEGNLTAPQPDSDGKQRQVCARAKLAADGTPLRDATGNPVPEWTECRQNSGISFAVPTHFILDLAKAKNLDLRL